MQIKTTMRYHLTLVRMAIIKNLEIINVRESGVKSEPFYTVGGVYHTDLFADFEESLYPWDKFHLIILYNLLLYC